MKRRSPAIFAAIVVIGVAFLAHREGKNREDLERRLAKATEEAEKTEAKPVEEPEAEGAAPPSLEAVAAVPTAPAGPSRFNKMPDGSDVPPLPAGAPKRVKWGVAIFRYQGAQSPPVSKRAKEEAEKLAQEALKTANEDFAAAVKMGDAGSSENVGWMRRGVLEPAVEYAVFTVDKGKIAKSVIDTPRGFWVLKRVR